MNSYARGNAITFKVKIKDLNEAYYDPNYVKIKILGPYGDEVLALTSMINDDVGKYHYTWQSSTSDCVGTYTTIVEATSGSYTSRIDPELFKLH